MYNIYRNDRAPNTKDKSHGGVLLPITKDFISSEITELKTNCEIVWAEINITGTKKICVASYYRPPDGLFISGRSNVLSFRVALSVT
jgi:hypothetical protein